MSELEEWRDIGDSVIDVPKGYYQISSLGRIKRIKPATGATVDFELKPNISKSEYPKVKLRFGRNNEITCAVHKLVALVFLGLCPEGYEVNHKDRNKLNPRLSNLEYISHRDNRLYSVKYKLTKEDLEKIRTSRKIQRELALDYNVSEATISYVIAGKAPYD